MQDKKKISAPALMYSNFYGQTPQQYELEEESVKDSWEGIQNIAIMVFLSSVPNLIEIEEYTDLEWSMDADPETIRQGDTVIEITVDNGVSRIRKGVAHHVINEAWVTEEGDPITMGNTLEENGAVYHIGRDPNHLPQRVGSTIIASMYGGKFQKVNLIRLWADGRANTWFSFDSSLDGDTLHPDSAIDSYVESIQKPATEKE